MRSPVPVDAAFLREAERTVRERAPVAAKRELEFFETNREAVEVLRARVPISGVVYEPCNGFGAISRCFPDCRVITNDMDPEKPADTHGDAATYVYRVPGTVVTNPPFSAAYEILTNARRQGLPCAMLLRLTFAEPTYDRGEWLEANPPEGQIVCPRYSFSGDGKTDSVTCAWMLWGLKCSPAIQVATTPSWRAELAARRARKERAGK